MRNGILSTRKSISALLIAGLLGSTAITSASALEQTNPAVPQSTPTRDLAAGFSDLVQKVMPAVVSVESQFGIQTSSDTESRTDQDTPNFKLPDLPEPFRRFFEPLPNDRFGIPNERFGMPDVPGRGQGSGFFISEDGYVVTNNHVVDGARDITVKDHNGREYKAKVIGTDPKTDLALLKVDGPERIAYVNFSTKEPKVGDWVVAVGNPYGFGGTVTTGVISARGRDIGSGPYDDYLQIDAPINRGNSGGPAFNLEGEVIGVNTAIYSPSGGSVGIGFAIPSSEAVGVIAELKEKGSVTRGWLGVQIQPITSEIADSMGLRMSTGVLVSEVTPNSPALKAGIKVGDAITKLDGEVVKYPNDLARRIARLSPGQPAKITVMRDGKEEVIATTIATMPSEKQVTNLQSSDDRPAGKLGLTLEPAPDGKGVRVAAVKPDSPAASKGLKPGDVILKVGSADVNAPAAVKSALEEAAKGGLETVLILVRSGDRQRFVALPASTVS
jgi:serine protease Do